ncbi:enoyl-CoA hydratase/isomerase family protein [Cryptosporangium phraense]|uniref:Enoyl-CoA hydratase/isomerase family protein n=1 Tax=Cryptosporangium phraense TaxID=2593070 RepID=A0A545AKQ1_9ACTN|nr:enoyl-CoA hydratase-related protein [Cryptosporangium phraense]TQS41894.1 enoyl-CoA hydratase/isomerase family protein [Cryptosporangium phraense]
MAEEGRVRTEDHGRVRVLTFDRPSRANAFDRALYRRAAAALTEADTDDAVGVVVLTGAGRTFTAGTDLAEMADTAEGGAADEGHPFDAFLDAVVGFGKPLLAAVNGAGVGLGLTLLAHCDLVLVSENARLKAPFTQLGVVPEAAGSYLLPRRMGVQRATEALLTSDWISAAEAVDSGLALRAYAPADLLSAAIGLAARIAAHPDASVRATKALITASRREAVAEARRREGAAFADILRSPAMGDAIRHHLAAEKGTR